MQGAVVGADQQGGAFVNLAAVEGEGPFEDHDNLEGVVGRKDMERVKNGLRFDFEAVNGFADGASGIEFE